MLKQPNILLVEVPPQFIALCESTGVSPQAALRGMAAMVCGLQYDDHNRLVPLEGEAAYGQPGAGGACARRCPVRKTGGSRHSRAGCAAG